MRDILEEYLRPSQVEQISTNENADAATSHNQQSSHRNDVPAQSISRAKKKNVDSALNSKQQYPNNLDEKQRNNQATREKMDAVQSTAIPEDEIKKLQVATVYYNMGDLNMAKSLLKELEQSSFDKIKNDAKSLLREIDR
jgi:FimV-like protein